MKVEIDIPTEHEMNLTDDAYKQATVWLRQEDYERVLALRKNDDNVHISTTLVIEMED